MNNEQLTKTLGTIKNYVDTTKMNYLKYGSIDVDTLKTTGIYSLASNCTNNATTNAGTMVVDFNVGTPYQLWIPDNTHAFHKRNWNKTNSTWGAWTATIASGISGNAATATRLATARNITLTGDVTGSVSFNGTSDVSITTVVGDNSHSHSNYVAKAGDTMTGGLTISKTGDGVTLLNLATERAWAFKQKGTGGSAALDLQASTDGKSFRIVDASGAKAASFSANTNGVSLALDGSLTATGNASVSGTTTSTGGFISGSTVRSDTALTDDLGTGAIPWRYAYLKQVILAGEANKNYGSVRVETVGTTSTVGEARLVLGNNTASGTASNAKGQLFMYGTNTGYTVLNPGNNSTSNITLTLPSSGGTLARTSDNITGSSASCTGNAATTTKLATARTINGTSFDGSANITTANWGTARNIYIADSSATNTGSAVSVNGSGNATLKLPATIKATLSGNASTATKLATARTINGTSFDGSANITTANWGTARKINGTSVNGSADVLLPLEYHTCSVGDNNTNLYHHILASGQCAADYIDKSITIMIVGHNSGGCLGIAKCTLRTNKASGGDTGHGEINWLVRSNISENQLCYNIRNTAKDTYMDVFYKSNGTYASVTWYVLGEGARGGQSSSTWTKNNTNASGTNAYTEAGMKAIRSYTSTLVSAGTNGVVGNASKAKYDNKDQQIDTTYIKGLSVSGKTITYTKGDGTKGTITTQDTNTTYNTGNASTAGLTKLYTGTGTATDGTMTQAAIKSALDGKAASSHGTHVSYGGNGSASTVSRSDHTHSYLPLAGGTLTGKITTPNNAPGITFGDDATICDRNIANHIVIEGATATAGGITFGSGKDTNIYRGGANLLKTDDTFNAVGGFQWNGTSLDNRYAPKSHTHNYAGSGSAGGSANSAVKLSTARTINGTSFDGSANITTANWGTARTITIGGKGKSVNGSGNVSWSLSEIGAAASSHNHGLLHDNFGVTIADTKTDSGWSMINSSYNGYILKSIRTNASAPAWLVNNYGAGVAFGGADTKGVLSVAYAGPSIRFAGGNGSKPVWYMSLTGSSGKSYNMDSLAAATATKLATARSINGTNFDGTGNITTANWGTARTITIGGKGKSVNGSANVSWTLDEIGAAPKSHTHNYAPASHNHTVLTGEVKINNANGSFTDAWNGQGCALKVGGHMAIGGTTMSSGEYRSYSANAFRAVQGDYGFFIRNDGSHTYFMLTNAGDQYGNWNNFRPITIVNSTGEALIGGTIDKWNGYRMRTGAGLGGQAGSITFSW